MKMDYLPITIRKQKNIALATHDQKKRRPIQWCGEYKDILSKHFLCGTDTMARTITGATNLSVKGYNSSPLGGGQQTRARIVEGKIDFVIFLSDPLIAQFRDPDAEALLRIAQIYGIPITNNRASADFMTTSSLMNEKYEHDMVNFRQSIADRVNTLQEQDIQRAR